MSCLSRIFGVIVTLVPGLGSLWVALHLVERWPELGLVKGPLYTLVTAITGAVCLCLGLILVFGRNRVPEPEAVAPLLPTAAPPPVPVSIFAGSEDPNGADASADADAVALPEDSPEDSPEARIRRLARGRADWQVSAPQLAHLTNLNLGVADATARAMASRGDIEITTGAQGETIYVFNSVE